MHLRQLVVLAVIGFFSPGLSAAAQDSNTCKILKAQLSNSGSSGETSAKFRRYATAAGKQAVQIQQVQSDLKKYGCSSGSFLVLGGRNGAICTKLAAAETKMQANLSALERKRDAFGKQNIAAHRRNIQAQLNANECYAQPDRNVVNVAVKTTTDSLRPTPTTLSRSSVTMLDKSGGDTINLDRGAKGNLKILIERKSSTGGNWRTLCVRTCDGYYFPISSAANSSDFGRDQRACQMMCPGTRTELYYHSAFGEESEDMMSTATGRPYTDLPTAFSYRSTASRRDKSCSCNISAFSREMQRREALVNGSPDEEAPVTTSARPSTRPDPGEDPETIANSHADLTPQAIAAVVKSTTTPRNLNSQQKHVRVVGPVFLPARSEKLDFTSNTEKLQDLFK